MTNPIHDFLAEKQAATQLRLPFGGAGLGDAVRRHGGQIPEMFGKAMAGAGAAAAVGLAVGGAQVAAHKLFEAATKGRDFRKMIEFNPDLALEHERDPKTFNQLYSSLRAVNHQFAQDPVIAGSYMRRMVGSPMAGGVLTDAVTFQNARDKTSPSLGDLVQRQAIGGTSKAR